MCTRPENPSDRKMQDPNRILLIKDSPPPPVATTTTTAAPVLTKEDQELLDAQAEEERACKEANRLRLEAEDRKRIVEELKKRREVALVAERTKDASDHQRACEAKLKASREQLEFELVDSKAVLATLDAAVQQAMERLVVAERTTTAKIQTYRDACKVDEEALREATITLERIRNPSFTLPAPPAPPKSRSPSPLSLVSPPSPKLDALATAASAIPAVTVTVASTMKRMPKEEESPMRRGSYAQAMKKIRREEEEEKSIISATSEGEEEEEEEDNSPLMLKSMQMRRVTTRPVHVLSLAVASAMVHGVGKATSSSYKWPNLHEYDPVACNEGISVNKKRRFKLVTYLCRGDPSNFVIYKANTRAYYRSDVVFHATVSYAEYCDQRFYCLTRINKGKAQFLMLCNESKVDAKILGTGFLGSPDEAADLAIRCFFSVFPERATKLGHNSKTGTKPKVTVKVGGDGIRVVTRPYGLDFFPVNQACVLQETTKGKHEVFESVLRELYGDDPSLVRDTLALLK